MNLHRIIVESINQSAAHVFATMVGAELGSGESSIDTGTPDANDGMVSFIGVAGSWAGTGSLTCSPSLACRICSQMLLTEFTVVDEEVLDAVAELTNMIIGCVKTELEVHLGPLGLSIPTVVFGGNFRTKSAGADWIVVRFPCEGEHLTVRVCLAPRERAARTFYPAAPGSAPASSLILP
jgi:chemotaxis protein CheX